MKSFTLQEWKCLVFWLKEIGINTLEQLRYFIENVTDGTKEDILNKAHACFIYGIPFGEVDYA